MEVAAPQTESTVEAQPTGAPEAKPETLGDIAKEATRKYKLKVDGEEVEVDETELKRGYTHQRAANKILQEGKLARKQAEEFIAMMKDPKKIWEAALKLGHDPRKLSEEYLGSILEDEMMDPKDKELRDTKKKLSDLEDMDKAEKKAKEDKLHADLKEKFAKEYSDQFVKALQDTQIPPTKEMVAEMAKYIQRSAAIGFKLSPDEAAKLVKEDLEVKLRRIIGESDGETLLKLLGDDVANKVRKFDTSRVKDPM